MNKEQKAHDLAVVTAKYYVNNNDEYQNLDKSERLKAVITDLSLIYDDAYNDILKM